jgi:hypothetical protein
VERLLALGATRWEATRAPVSRAVRLAMTPLLNQMSVVGLVSIPGMMTGQILAGTDPTEAARYQVRGEGARAGACACACGSRGPLGSAAAGSHLVRLRARTAVRPLQPLANHA